MSVIHGANMIYGGDDDAETLSGIGDEAIELSDAWERGPEPSSIDIENALGRLVRSLNNIIANYQDDDDIMAHMTDIYAMLDDMDRIDTGLTNDATLTTSLARCTKSLRFLIKMLCDMHGESRLKAIEMLEATKSFLSGDDV